MVKLTEAQRDFLERLSQNRVLKLADRAEDRTRQSLRRLGYCQYSGTPKRWQLLPDGRSALGGE